MPVRKVKNGWMWGSKGPFESKEKAEQVARAAYASGYRGNGKPRAPRKGQHRG